MWKRKRDHSDDEEYLERKVKRLMKKKSRMRRRRRQHSYSSSTSSESNRHGYWTHRDDDPAQVEEYHWPVDSNSEEFPYGDDAIVDLVDVTESQINVAANSSGLQSVVVEPVPSTSRTPPAAPPPPAAARELAVAPAPTAPAAAADAKPTPAAAGPPVDTSTTSADQTVSELEPSILSLLGDEPTIKEKFGSCIHNDIAFRWSDILVNGLEDHVLNEIVKRYEIPENLKLAQSPLLNPEIKAASNENVQKRDNILSEKQKLLSRAITGVASAMTVLLTSEQSSEDTRNHLLKSLSDAGRLLCHLHSSETQTRRHFLLTCLNKEVEDTIKDLKRDDLLFGKDLQEGLKSMKAISKSGAELKPAASKSKLPAKDKQAEAYTPRALNWRGQPPAAVRPPPRRPPTTASSTRGGRRPPPPPPPPALSRSSRR